MILASCTLPWTGDESQVESTIPSSDSGLAKDPLVDQPASLPRPTQPANPSQPTNPQPNPGACDKAQFIADVTVPDGSTFSAGDQFTKTWKLKNMGSCAWTSGYVLAFDSGDKLGGPTAKPLGSAVAPGEGVNVSVDLTAPSAAGPYRGYWILRNAEGDMIPVENGYNGRSFYVDIVVAPMQSPTTQPAAFEVTNVSFSVSHTGFCGRGITYQIEAEITTNGAGKVDYQWVHSHAGNHELPKLLMFNSAGTQTITTEYEPGSTPPFTGMWMDLYINDPNAEQFGRASLDC
jgi:hypothetical protein